MVYKPRAIEDMPEAYKADVRLNIRFACAPPVRVRRLTSAVRSLSAAVWAGRRAEVGSSCGRKRRWSLP